MPPVAFFGPAGTFAEEALLTQDDLAARERVAIVGVPDVIAAVESGECEIGFIPIENSIEGSVSVTLDTLAFESDLLIQREVDLPISMGLFAKPGHEARRHQAGAVVPDRGGAVPGVPAQAAARTRRSSPRTPPPTPPPRWRGRSAHDQAAIGNPLAAEIHGLDVLAREIADHPENQTRFVVVGRGHPRAAPATTRRRSSASSAPTRPGSLLAMLQEFAARAINLTKLESRPTKQSLGDYCFVIDFEGHIADEVVTDCLRTLAAKVAHVKFLGSYPVAGLDGPARRTAATKAWRDADRWVGELRGRVRDD